MTLGHLQESYLPSKGKSLSPVKILKTISNLKIYPQTKFIILFYFLACEI